MRPFPTPDAKPPLRTRPALPLVRPFLVHGRRSAPRVHLSERLCVVMTGAVKGMGEYGDGPTPGASRHALPEGEGA